MEKAIEKLTVDGGGGSLCTTLSETEKTIRAEI
ncbi:uncharacterized protein G2W53_006661 [Senna tora]|uniref:Uncharacterized protein n=1 Tax=Senna tora TaxID=362788 RepID=A0A834X523_9FABA|nr:uncharacterized protein G2W53_006661 [Senna tora]